MSQLEMDFSTHNFTLPVTRPDTLTGTRLLEAFPIPNWPSSLFPQQYKLLSVSTEQVCHCPVATADATDPVMVPLNSLLVIRV
jgi:hypothetical protein